MVTTMPFMTEHLGRPVCYHSITFTVSVRLVSMTGRCIKTCWIQRLLTYLGEIILPKIITTGLLIYILDYTMACNFFFFFFRTTIS